MRIWLKEIPAILADRAMAGGEWRVKGGEIVGLVGLDPGAPFVRHGNASRR